MDSVLELHSDADKWDGARFERVKRISNTRVGAIGQDFVEKFAGELGIECEFPINLRGQRANQSPWDIKLDGLEFELKTATEDVSGNFQFNHFRYARTYDAVLCLGVAPANLYFGLWSKADLATGKAGTLVSMEKSGSASYKLTKRPANLRPIVEFGEAFADFRASWT